MSGGVRGGRDPGQARGEGRRGRDGAPSGEPGHGRDEVSGARDQASGGRARDEPAGGRRREAPVAGEGTGVAAAGLVLLLAVLPAYLTSGRLAPGWAVALLLVVWLVLAGCAAFWFRRRPHRVLALPFAAAAVWFAVLAVGQLVLGWPA
ncbi:hypothetical protein MF406_08725 [Georgenia sp. TF02-10]|uniref:hypothetical protein n=1 Tax=Georgenia sp. TF02-10 TaxID=2917725 RepID=UPI001FA6AB9C|nr:hypothetical protein [Georgenia sp. TF02-10]UNX56260.1 hypothetical protein MF406_08725 [Georgenia sp. TF02-10]